MKQGYFKDSPDCLFLMHLNQNKEKTQIHNMKDKKDTLKQTDEIQSIFMAYYKILYYSKLENLKEYSNSKI